MQDLIVDFCNVIIVISVRVEHNTKITNHFLVGDNTFKVRSHVVVIKFHIMMSPMFENIKLACIELHIVVLLPLAKFDKAFLKINSIFN